LRQPQVPEGKYPVRVLSIRISGLSGNIKLKGSVERTLEARFFERIDELTIEFTELLRG
jgi:hypothetical protein